MANTPERGFKYGLSHLLFVAQLWVLSCSCWDLPRNKKEVGSRNMNYGHLQTKNSDVSLSHLWQNAYSLNYVIPGKVNLLLTTFFDFF